eukprot:4376569-Amphidinium_carterae.2
MERQINVDHDSAAALVGTSDQASYWVTGSTTVRQRRCLPELVIGKRSSRDNLSRTLIQRATDLEDVLVGSALGATSRVLGGTRVEPSTSMLSEIGTTALLMTTRGSLAGPRTKMLDFSTFTEKSKDSRSWAASCMDSSNSSAEGAIRIKSSA